MPLQKLPGAIDDGHATRLVVLAAPDSNEHLTAIQHWIQRRGSEGLWCVAPGASRSQLRSLMRAGAWDVIFEDPWLAPLLTSLVQCERTGHPSVLDLTPVMVTHTSREGHILYANQAASSLLSAVHTNAMAAESRINNFYVDRVDRSTLLTRLQSEPVVHFTTRLIAADGTPRPLEVVASAKRTEHNKITSLIAVAIDDPGPESNPLWDIVRSTNERFRQLADAITDLMVAADPDGIVTYWNTTAQTYSGLSAEQTVGLHVDEVLHMVLIEGADVIGQALKTTGTSTVEFHVPNNTSGNFPPGNYQARIYSSCTGTVVIGVDLTDRTRTELALRAALADRETLLREVHHRTKNNLQIITSLLNLTFLPDADPQMRSKLTDIQRRVHTMALLHEQLYRGEDLSGINAGSYIRQLCQNLLSSFQHQNRVKLNLSLASISLGLDTSLRTGLLLHELVVNSLKHAFPNNRAGTISVSLTIATGGEELELHVSDDGVGFSSTPSSGIGLQLVDSLVAQLRGTLTRTMTEGTHVRITYPWEDS